MVRKRLIDALSHVLKWLHGGDGTLYVMFVPREAERKAMEAFLDKFEKALARVEVEHAIGKPVGRAN